MSEASCRVVTGAGRGLGLEMTRQWLDAGHRTFALVRSPERSRGLSELAARHRDLVVLGCDVADEESVAAAAAAIHERADAIDVLVNNAGVYGSKASGLDDVDLGEIRGVFEVNTLGPLRVTRALRPLLRRGRSPRVVNVTSLMGSIADNSSGGAWAYRLSKSALNMVTRNCSHEMRADGVVCAAMHPGWVQTDMGGPHAPLPIAEAVGEMVATIERLGDQHGGGLFDRLGDPLPW